MSVPMCATVALNVALPTSNSRWRVLRHPAWWGLGSWSLRRREAQLKAPYLHQCALIHVFYTYNL
jgi:hypothetical protein